jgi:hypothetical protein
VEKVFHFSAVGLSRFFAGLGIRLTSPPSSASFSSSGGAGSSYRIPTVTEFDRHCTEKVVIWTTLAALPLRKN